MRAAFAFTAVFVAMTTGAAAQEEAPKPPLSDLYACTTLAEDAARLACFDQSVGALAAAERGGRFVTLDTLGAEKLEREAFGFAMPSLNLLLPSIATPSSEPATKEISAVITRVGGRDGKGAFYLDNGQVWTPTETVSSRGAKVGAAVTVRRAALGSYLMSFGSGAAVRVRRVQ
jgi:hypothetical protein